MDALSEANGTFAFHLLKMLCQDSPSRNVFYSPVSISSALAMVFLGAKGNTAAQMAQVNLPVTQEKGLPFQLLCSVTQLHTLCCRIAMKQDGEGSWRLHTYMLVSGRWGCPGNKTLRAGLESPSLGLFLGKVLSN